MRIALVVHDLHEHGGHSLYTRILADELSVNNDVTVFANICERPADARWDFQPVHAVRLNSLSCVKTFPIGMLAQSRALDHFEIRHMQGYCGGAPNVVTAHRCMASYVRSLSSLSFRHRASLRVMLAAESRFYRNYDGAIIAISNRIANELREFYGVRGPVKIVPHGVDSRRFQNANRERYRAKTRAQLGISEGETVALYVGDLTKAHLHLKQLSQAAPEVRLVIVSASRSYHWTSPNVQILPLTRTIEHFYAAADAFAFPSVNDPFGMVVLEAMASGLPVFCSDQAGAAELIESGKDGFVFPLDGWVEATAEGLRDCHNLTALALQAETTAQKYSWSDVVRDVEQVYREVIAGEPATAGGAISSRAYRYQQ
jgi:UDP-glucose:(heptosyl)LPS alpha-1,3-glucosyltransferase